MKIENLYNEYIRGYEGEVFYTPLYGEMMFEIYSINTQTPIHMEMGEDSLWFQNDGSYRGDASSCLLFPSKELYEAYPTDPVTAWNKWQEEHPLKYPCQIYPWWTPQLYEQYWFVGHDGVYHSTINHEVDSDTSRIKIGNCFQNEAYCIEMCEKLKQLFIDFHKSKEQ